MMRSLFRWLRRGVVLGAFVVILLVTNIATLVSATVHDALWSAIRGVGSAVVDADWTRKPTQAELDANRKKLSADLDGTRADLNAVQHRADGLVRTRDRLQSDLTTAERRVGALTDEASDLQRELRAASAALDSELTNTRRLTGQIDEFRLRLDLADADLLTKSDELVRVRAQRDVGLDELEALRRATSDIPAERMQKASELVDGMERRVTSSIRRSTGGEVAQMVPFLGIGAGLALIAWDVHDACSQLRDVEELRRLVSGESLNSSDDPEVGEMCGMSRAALIARFTGKDLAFSRCLEARQATLKIDPPECIGYELELPHYDNAEDVQDVVIELPVYD